MEPYYKIVASGGKIPRKLKKLIKKIPVGNYCYGSKIGDKGKMEYGMKKYKGGCCPYYRVIKEADEDEDAVAYCAFIKREGGLELNDQVKICREYEYLFPEYKHLIGKTYETIFKEILEQQKSPVYKRRQLKQRQYYAQLTKSKTKTT